MEIGKQIKTLRQKMGLSQEELAEKIFVTRQTISNWENNKNYPDINSLVLLSNLFGVSLDILVKGDLKEMEQQVKAEDIKKWNRDGWIFLILLITAVVSAVPLFLFGGVTGLVFWGAIYAVAMYYAIKVEKQKKSYDIQTYREILAFTQGKRLDEIERIREKAKRPYQTALYAIIVGAVAAAISIAMLLLLC